MKDINILAIETSCDETSAAVIQNGRTVLSNIIASQVDFHKKYGGVVPEIASRKHLELIIPVIDRALKEADTDVNKIDAVGVTYGPGLAGALLVGVSAAKSLAWSLQVPLIGVNHIKGHICANYISHQELEPPFICLVISGGHSHIIYVNDYFDYKVLGRTRDDAAGEAFDKTARALGLGYPGGPLIDKVAEKGNDCAIKFPRTIFGKGIYDFSFSGIKTSVVNYINQQKQKDVDINIPDIAASFQKAVADVLLKNTIDVAIKYNINKIALAGGVAANTVIRKAFLNECKRNDINFYCPSSILCTDNAAMIGCAAYYEYLSKNCSALDLNAVPGLKIM